MINYHLYRNYWPLLALGRFARAIANTNPEERQHDSAAACPKPAFKGAIEGREA
jgi:hypothetical protein